MKRFKFTLIISLLLLSVLFVLNSCNSSVVENPQSTSNPHPETTPSLPQDESIEPFEIEQVGESSDGNIDFFRDITTDVLYVRYADTRMYAGLGGLTIMLDPETGLPLTYTRYMELYKQSQAQ